MVQGYVLPSPAMADCDMEKGMLRPDGNGEVVYMLRGGRGCDIGVAEMERWVRAGYGTAWLTFTIVSDEMAALLLCVLLVL